MVCTHFFTRTPTTDARRPATSLLAPHFPLSCANDDGDDEDDDDDGHERQPEKKEIEVTPLLLLLLLLLLSRSSLVSARRRYRRPHQFEWQQTEAVSHPCPLFSRSPNVRRDQLATADALL